VSVEPLETTQLPKDLNGFCSEEFAADYLGVKRATLRTWRKRGCGPPWYKIGDRLVRYKTRGLVSWANSQPGGQAA